MLYFNIGYVELRHNVGRVTPYHEKSFILLS